MATCAHGLVSIDASSFFPTPQIDQLQMGSAAADIAPNGETLTVNSQSLVLNDTPWLPVAGEFY
jgi:hypothetical protein